MQVEHPNIAAVQLKQRGSKGEGTGVHWCHTDPQQMATCSESGHIHVWNAAGNSWKEDEDDDSPIVMDDRALESNQVMEDMPSEASSQLSEGMSEFRLSLVENRPYLSASSQVELTPQGFNFEPPTQPRRAQQARQPTTPQTQLQTDTEAWVTPTVTAPYVAPIDLESGWRMNLSPDRRSQRSVRHDNLSQLVPEMPSQHGLVSLGDNSIPVTEDAAPQPIRCVLAPRLHDSTWICPRWV
jgi:hypothetical protein